MNVKIKRLHPEAIIPRYATKGSAGFDFYACLPTGKIVIKPGEREVIDTGVALDIPDGYEVQIRPRSGWAYKFGLSVVNTPGTIDSDYVSGIKVILINHGKIPVEIRHKDRIAQGVLSKVPRASFIEVDVLKETERGGGSFGSTGIR